MDHSMELIQSSFSFLKLVMKYMVSDWVESSKAYYLLRMCSAPLTVRQVAKGMTPRSLEIRVTVKSLDQQLALLQHEPAAMPSFEVLALLG
nr:hypothetical protein CFP56_69219 [Quercus suber]